MATLSEAYRDNPLLPHHIIPLDFRSARSVPESHVWSQPDGFSSSEFSGEWLSLPVVDLMDPEAPELMGLACQSWGAFQLTGHGIPVKLVEEAEAEARRLFGLPTEQKLKALRSPGGATGYGAARISPFFQKYMWHEGFTIMGSPEDHARELWPHGYQRFCDGKLSGRNEDPSRASTTNMLKSLNIDHHHEQQVLNWLANTSSSSSSTSTSPKEQHMTSPCTALQLNSYPSCPDPNRAMGLAPHTDTFLLTILHQTQSDVGLQIRKELGRGSSAAVDDDQSAAVWVPVSPVPGALVVNVGDLLHIMSNGRFLSVVHRAVVNQTRQRFSFAYFYGPPTDFTVSPVLSRNHNMIIDKSGHHLMISSSGSRSTSTASGQRTDDQEVRVPVYRSITVKEYVGIKAKNLDKALALIRIHNSLMLSLS